MIYASFPEGTSFCPIDMLLTSLSRLFWFFLPLFTPSSSVFSYGHGGTYDALIRHAHSLHLLMRIPLLVAWYRFYSCIDHVHALFRIPITRLISTPVLRLAFLPFLFYSIHLSYFQFFWGGILLIIQRFSHLSFMLSLYPRLLLQLIVHSASKHYLL